jgi:hypothetical protein
MEAVSLAAVGGFGGSGLQLRHHVPDHDSALHYSAILSGSPDWQNNEGQNNRMPSKEGLGDLQPVWPAIPASYTILCRGLSKPKSEASLMRGGEHTRPRVFRDAPSRHGLPGDPSEDRLPDG